MTTHPRIKPFITKCFGGVERIVRFVSQSLIKFNLIMERMTIHRALSELKLIDSRIEKGINQLNIVGYSNSEGKINNLYTKEEYANRAKASLQSVNALLSRKHSIKSAITKSNAVTKVSIAKTEMTVSEAINYKTIIEQRKRLTGQIENQRGHFIAEINKNNDKVNESALRLAESALGKDNVKLTDNDVISVTEPYLKKNLVNLEDPLESLELIEAYGLEISTFEADIDATLSESNATTFVEV